VPTPSDPHIVDHVLMPSTGGSYKRCTGYIRPQPQWAEVFVAWNTSAELKIGGWGDDGTGGSRPVRDCARGGIVTTSQSRSSFRPGTWAASWRRRLTPRSATRGRDTMTSSTTHRPTITARVAEDSGAGYSPFGRSPRPLLRPQVAANRFRGDILLFIDARCRALPGLLDAHRALHAKTDTALSCTDVRTKAVRPLRRASPRHSSRSALLAGSG